MTKKTKINIESAPLDNITNMVTKWVGSTASIIVHTLFFVVSFSLVRFGLSLDTVLLILTTAVSLEAIYLAIFIQRSVNRQGDTIEDEFDELEEKISEDIDETEAAIMRDLDETERHIAEDLDETEQNLAEDIDETEAAVLAKKSSDIFDRQLEDVLVKIRAAVREEVRDEVRRALDDRPKAK